MESGKLSRICCRFVTILLSVCVVFVDILLFFCCIVPVGVPMAGKQSEEIVVQDVADSQQGVGVNPGVFERPVQVLPRELQLPCEPCHASALSLEFELDEIPDVRLLWRFVHVVFVFLFHVGRVWFGLQLWLRFSFRQKKSRAKPHCFALDGAHTKAWGGNLPPPVLY